MTERIYVNSFNAVEKFTDFTIAGRLTVRVLVLALM